MALTDMELQRLRLELGSPNLETAAEPYIGIASIFEQVIQPFLLGGAATTSSTTVVAATAPAPATLTLASAVGFASGDVVIVDVDARQERATVQALSGSTITVLLSLPHVGSYPVVVEGAEAIIRDILAELRALSSGNSSTLRRVTARAGIKSLDRGDVEFFGGGSTLGSQGVDPVTQTLRLQNYWRDELARALGIQRLNATNGGTELSVY
jgi:hypothetical protein